MLQIDKPCWLERHIVNIIAGACVAIVAVVIGTLILSVQIVGQQARNAQEIRDIQIMQRTNAARIQALADEQGWVRSNVKIQAEMMK